MLLYACESKVHGTTVACYNRSISEHTSALYLSSSITIFLLLRKLAASRTLIDCNHNAIMLCSFIDEKMICPCIAYVYFFMCATSKEFPKYINIAILGSNEESSKMSVLS